ncbi:glycosyltransferase [Reinekea marina]|uniref:Glycosyltransferase n=1 Tax=Reinekea marina TaxID=1310421 RepID=A0ABV7WUM4_9GAMM|nr:glycosyltransferase [Reinekea marina]MDN3648154.1 glycosyltransferase [Reinekea marina]
MTSTATPPTILHVIDTTGPGGAETVFLNLAEKMQIDGYRNLALIKGPGWVQNQLEQRGIPFKVIKPFGFLSIPYYRALLKFVKSENIKFVQAHLLGSALSFSIVSLITRIPVVATLHGQVDVNPNERFMVVKRWLLKKGLRKVVAVSGQLADYLAQRKLFARDQLSVIHNGIDVARYQVEITNELKQRFNLPDNATLVGSIGNIRPAKDYPTLIAAAKIVITQNPDTHFLIAGHAKQALQSQLETQVQELGLTNHIHFLGFLDNTPGFLAQLNVFVLSSEKEGFSISTLEAMAAKIPIVATRCGGPEEILEQGITGTLVDIKSPAQLAQAILTSPTRSNAQVKQAFKVVQEKFSEQILTNKYQQLCASQL